MTVLVTPYTLIAVCMGIKKGRRGRGMEKESSIFSCHKMFYQNKKTKRCERILGIINTYQHECGEKAPFALLYVHALSCVYLCPAFFVMHNVRICKYNERCFLESGTCMEKHVSDITFQRRVGNLSWPPNLFKLVMHSRVALLMQNNDPCCFIQLKVFTIT